MNGGSDPYKRWLRPHFLKDYNKDFQIHVCKLLYTLRFLAEASTKLQKMHFFGQFKEHNPGRKHGNPEKSSKTGQIKKSLISTPACFLTAIAKV